MVCVRDRWNWKKLPPLQICHCRGNHLWHLGQDQFNWFLTEITLVFLSDQMHRILLLLLLCNGNLGPILQDDDLMTTVITIQTVLQMTIQTILQDDEYLMTMVMEIQTGLSPIPRICITDSFLTHCTTLHCTRIYCTTLSFATPLKLCTFKQCTVVHCYIMHYTTDRYQDLNS